MKHKLFATLFVLSLILSACVFNEEVQPNQVGVITDAGAIKTCVGPGLQNDGGFYTDLKTYNIDPLTFNVANASVATADTQIVSVEITVQTRRRSDCDATKLLFSSWSSMLVDQNIIDSVGAVAADAIKGAVRSYTLTSLLDDRDGLGLSIKGELEEHPLSSVLEFIAVAVPNVDVDDQYEALLQERNNLREQVNVENQRQSVIEAQYANQIFEQDQKRLAAEAQLAAEQAVTAVEVEKARRAGEVIEAQNAIYETNEQAYELERLRRLADVLNDGTVYFVPSDTDLNIFYNPDGVVPVE